MNIADAHKNKFKTILLLIASSFYFLEKVWLNPAIIWTVLPLYFGWFMFNWAYKTQSRKKLYACYGFLLISVIFSYLYHLAWFFDWKGTATGSSTSALIFAVFPIYAVLIGGFGYLAGYVLGFGEDV